MMPFLPFIRALGGRSYRAFQLYKTPQRFTSGCGGRKKGLVLGYFEDSCKDPVLTKAASSFDNHVGGKLREALKDHNPCQQCRVFHDIDDEFAVIALASLGPEKQGYNELEALDEAKESIRHAAGQGARCLLQSGVTQIYVDEMCGSEQAAEGAALATWTFQELRNKNCAVPIPGLEIFEDGDCAGWQRGIIKADAQNLARRLADAPANLMTPLEFAQQTINELCPCGIKVDVYDKDWIEHKKMFSFLSVARGSCEPPIFIEATYCGGASDEKPVLLVGKGVTFESGGLCLRPCRNMKDQRTAMSGAAAVVAVMKAAAMLNLPINIVGLVPLCENMPSGMAMRPGDIVVALNGKSIQIEDTRRQDVMLADPLVYGQLVHKPCLLIDLSTSTDGVRSALGAGPSGVFCNSQTIWSQVRKAGVLSGDRVWRLPLWKFFTKKVTDYPEADVNNTGHGHGEPCLGAAFLNEFIDCVDWVHFDVTGVGLPSKDNVVPYLAKGVATGRPTRTLIQLLYQLSCPAERERQLVPVS